jgi:DNA-binding CsgD family transcriptional regulator
MPREARNVEWLRAVEQERDVLRHLVAARQGALVLWDHRLRAVWNSPQAAIYLAAGPVRVELERAAASALEQLEPLDDDAPLGCSALGWVRMPSLGRGAPLLAEFSSVRTPQTCLWLLAELKAYRERCPRFASLSAAERRVLGLLMAGLSNREIGRELFVSLETVKTHVSRILQKLEVTSRAKAASLGREAGFELRSQGPTDLLAPGQRSHARRRTG